MEFEEFIKEIKKVKSNRVYTIKDSYGSKDSFSYYRNHKPSDKKYVITDCEYLKIIRTINNCLREELSNGKDVVLPQRMGILEIRKNENKAMFVDGKLKVYKPVDWNATLKLWHEDEECMKNKTVIKFEYDEYFRVYYNKYKANYNNKAFYEFKPNRELKIKLKENIRNNKIDAFTYGS